MGKLILSLFIGVVTIASADEPALADYALCQRNQAECASRENADVANCFDVYLGCISSASGEGFARGAGRGVNPSVATAPITDDAGRGDLVEPYGPAVTPAPEPITVSATPAPATTTTTTVSLTPAPATATPGPDQQNLINLLSTN